MHQLLEVVCGIKRSPGEAELRTQGVPKQSLGTREEIMKMRMAGVLARLGMQHRLERLGH